jgi:hypothetical protein
MSNPTPTSRWLATIRRQDGITMMITIGVMFVTSLLLVSAFTAADGEIHLTSTDTAQKKAYYAAEAGIENYQNHLTEDGNYLSYCAEPPVANPALNQAGETDHRETILNESGESTGEEYAIQLLPAESAPEKDRKCDPNSLVETMLEEKTGGPVGTFRIESTGYSGNVKRSIVATFRNANFVSFVWYTKFETGDPAVYGEPPPGKPNYYIECAKFYGERPAQGGSPERCRNNFFITGESVNGPMHTEDHAGVCGSPVFGRNENDRIEFGHAVSDEGYSNEGYGCGTPAPVFKGKHIAPKEVPSIEPPPGDEELKHIVEPAYEYKGKTEIILEGSTMTVIKHVGSTTPGEEEKIIGVEYPPNGVIYVTSENCSEAYSPFGPKPGYAGNELGRATDTKCGNVYVHGEYTSSLTIAAENDIIINGNILTPVSEPSKIPTSNALLGLIANNFVRVYHPVVETYPAVSGKCKENGQKKVEKYNSTLKACEYTIEAAACDAPDASTDLYSPTIYAAMLAVKHAVIVDNFNCGEPTLGSLNIYGAVAGLYTNGFTGEFSGTSFLHGYPYNANYDDRLEVEEPPHFLNPIEASWYVQRETLANNPKEEG